MVRWVNVSLFDQCKCASPSDLKKSSGDWFYDQRVNRFSAAPGHDIVRASLKKRPPCEYRKSLCDFCRTGSVNLSLLPVECQG